MAKDPIKKAENGTYYFRANLGYHPVTGKQIQKYRSGFSTKKEARAEYSKLILASTEELADKKEDITSVIFGMLGDVVEFGQWKTHLRQESFIFAIGSVGTKLGNGITAAVLTQLLAFSGYVSKAGVTTQPQSVVNMIMNIYKVGPLIVWVTVVIILLLYRLDKKYPMIMKELEEREARGEL